MLTAATVNFIQLVCLSCLSLQQLYPGQWKTNSSKALPVRRRLLNMSHIYLCKKKQASKMQLNIDSNEATQESKTL